MKRLWILIQKQFGYPLANAVGGNYEIPKIEKELIFCKEVENKNLVPAPGFKPWTSRTATSALDRSTVARPQFVT